jgi:hypothetical protein
MSAGRERERFLLAGTLLILMSCSHGIAVEPIRITTPSIPSQPGLVLVLTEATRTFVSHEFPGTDSWNFPLW